MVSAVSQITPSAYKNDATELTAGTTMVVPGLKSRIGSLSTSGFRKLNTHHNLLFPYT